MIEDATIFVRIAILFPRLIIITIKNLYFGQKMATFLSSNCRHDFSLSQLLILVGI